MHLGNRADDSGLGTKPVARAVRAMTLLLYLVLFAALLAWRSRRWTGGHLAWKPFTHRPRKGPRKDTAERIEELDSADSGKKRVLTLGCTLQQPAWLVIAREKPHHRWLERLGLTRELQVGDAELDRLLYFTCDTPATLGRLASDPAFYQQLRALFADRNADELKAFGSKLWVTFTAVAKADADGAYVEDRFAAVDAIARLVPRHVPEAVTAGWWTPPRRAVAFMGAHLALFLLGATAWLPGLATSAVTLQVGQLLATAGLTGAVVTAAWLAGLALALRGSGWLALALVDFAVLGLAGLFACSWHVAREANVTFDGGAPTAHVRPLVARSCTVHCSKGSGKRRRRSTYAIAEAECLPRARPPTLAGLQARDTICESSARFQFDLAVQPWRADQVGPFGFQADAALYDTTRPGDLLRIPEQPGALGVAWVQSEAIAKVR